MKNWKFFAGAVTIILLCILCIVLSFYPYVFGNKQFIDLNQEFDVAIIKLPNGEVIEGEIAAWTDYEDGEQLQITFKDGTVYLASSYNCVLIDNK